MGGRDDVDATYLKTIVEERERLINQRDVALYKIQEAIGERDRLARANNDRQALFDALVKERDLARAEVERLKKNSDTAWEETKAESQSHGYSLGLAEGEHRADDAEKERERDRLIIDGRGTSIQKLESQLAEAREALIEFSEMKFVGDSRFDEAVGIIREKARATLEAMK